MIAGSTLNCFKQYIKIADIKPWEMKTTQVMAQTKTGVNDLWPTLRQV